MRMSQFFAIIILSIGVVFCVRNYSSPVDSPNGNYYIMSGDGTVYYPDALSIKVCVDKKFTGSPSGNEQCVDAKRTSYCSWAYDVGAHSDEFPIVVGIKTLNSLADDYNNYLSAPAGKNIVSILTTYVKNKMDVEGVTIDEAVALVKADLKITDNILGKQSYAGLKRVNFIAQSSEKAIAIAFKQLPDFDIAQISGLISVTFSAVAGAIVKIDEAVKNNQPVPTPTLPTDLVNSIKNANEKANINKPTVIPFVLQNAKYFKMPNGKFYILGGRAKLGNLESFSTILAMDPKTKTWEQIKNDELILEGRCENGRLEYGVFENNIIAFCPNGEWDGLSRAYYFNTEATFPTWWKAHDIDDVNKWNYCALFTIGGIAYKYLDSNRRVQKLDFSQDSLRWSSYGSANNKLCNSDTLYISKSGKLFFGVVTGGRIGYYLTTDDMETFVRIRGKSIFPADLRDINYTIFATETLDNNAYVFMLKDNKYSEYFTLDLTTLEWSDIKSAGGDAPSKEMSGPQLGRTKYVAHTLIDGKLYLFGASGENFSDKVYEFDTKTGNWRRF